MIFESQNTRILAAGILEANFTRFSNPYVKASNSALGIVLERLSLDFARIRLAASFETAYTAKPRVVALASVNKQTVQLLRDKLWRVGESGRELMTFDTSHNFL